MRIYVINLDRHTERMARMRDLLRDVDFERVPAVDGASLEGPAIRAKFPRRFEDMTRHERACVLSHAVAWRRLLESSDQHACVLEDDVVVSPDFAGFMAESSWIPERCDVLKIETFLTRIYVARRVQPFRDRRLARLYSVHLGSAAYIASRDGAGKLLAHAARPERPVDHLLFDVPRVVGGLRVLQLDPGLCVQLEQVPESQTEGEFKSSIQPAQYFTERRKPVEKIIWEVTRPWRQLVHFFSHLPLLTVLRAVEFR